MLELANAELTVELLDPVADHARLGPRFAWGGYIWQVRDRAIGTLLTGPEWPELSPTAHNGQGLPESFRHSTTDGKPLLWHGNEGLAPGSGALQRESNGTVVVREPATWKIDAHADRVIYRTAQKAGDWNYELERRIELHGRQIVSFSRLTNRGAAPLKLEWFAHPFFALEGDGKLRATLEKDTTLPENPGFALQDRELTFQRAFSGLHDGCLVLLGLPPQRPFAVTLTHPQLAWVRFSTDFAPAKCVLWANGNTLSFEPFLTLDLAPGESREWTLRYEFGPRR